jgi:hypothetical protein
MAHGRVRAASAAGNSMRLHNLHHGVHSFPSRRRGSRVVHPALHGAARVACVLLAGMEMPAGGRSLR